MFTNLLVVAILSYAIFWFYKKHKKDEINRRIEYISSYRFPDRVVESVLKTYPHLRKEDALKAIGALREYFIVATIANGKMVSMPSQVVDVAWHEFLLFTRQYDTFCKKAFGRFFHHHPVEAMASKTVAQDGMKLTWKIACKREYIDPKYPRALPLIFAIDKELNIPDGFKYLLNCSAYKSNNSTTGCGGYCASHIGCSGGCGGSIDSDASCGGSGCGGSSGGDGGCGGSSCGGGCGGS